MRLKCFSGWLSGILIISIIASSCDNEVPPAIQPSADHINIEGEGDNTIITFHNGEWIIDRIENRSGSGDYISGDIYSADGNLLAGNTELQLSGLGKLVSGWDDHGFTITRERADVLSISVNENWTENDFIFAIILQAGTEEKEIIVTQKKSQGYTFKDIEYLLLEGDGDRFSYENHTRNYPDSDEPTKLIIIPFTGVEDIYQYTHDTPEGLYWQQQNDVSVPVPVEVDMQTGGIECSEIEYLFTTTPVSKECAFLHLYEVVEVSAGYPFITVKITCRTRQVSYRATLINNRTGAEKVITGKWIEEVPTGEYSLSVQVLPKT